MPEVVSHEISEMPTTNTAVEAVSAEYSQIKAGNIGLILKSGGSMIQIHASMRPKFENGLWEILEPIAAKKKPIMVEKKPTQIPAKTVIK